MARKENDDWFQQVSSEFDRLTEEMLRGMLRPSFSMRQLWEPRVDVRETPTCLHVKVELAGVEPSAIHITLSGDQRSLILRGRREEGDLEPAERTSCHQLEIYYGEFERKIALPDIAFDKDNIKASYRNGILNVTVPKVQLPAPKFFEDKDKEQI